MSRERLIDIIKRDALKRGEFTLASGRKSNLYFDLRPVIQSPEAANIIADLILDEIGDADAVGGMESGAIPISQSVCVKSLALDKPTYSLFVRKRPKEHGRRRVVEGRLERGWRVVVVEDVITTGGSTSRAIDAIREEGGVVEKVVVVVDREEGARELLESKGVEVVALTKASDFL